ncbi:MAG: PAS domain-containing protein [Chloroflexi bacterium]|nr:PAS domain-containing protein [Chloroflexota bacterium]
MAPIPENETERLKALRQYAILDTEPEEAFDELTRLAAQVCQTPIALVTFVDAGRQWHKSRLGWEVAEVPREHSFCAYAILQPDLMVVEDTGADARFAGNPLVTEDPHIRFYAGMPLRAKFYAAAPLRTPGGHALGALCVMDWQPRKLTPLQAQTLRTLGNQVVSQLELRRSLAELSRKQRQTEVALKDSEAFYHSLVQNVPQNIFRKDALGRFTFANDRFCLTIGRSLPDILGKTDFDFFPADLAAKYRQDDERVMASGQAVETIEQHQTPDRGMLYVQVIKSPLRDASGEVAGIQGIFWDVTEQFKTQEALAYERDLLQAMLENIPDSIYFKDTASRVLACSRAASRRWGLGSPEEAIGKTDFDFFGPDHAHEAFDDEQRIIRTGQPVIAKTERESWTDGREAWVLTTKVPLRNKEGVITGTLGISKDITDLKRAERELALARDTALESAQLKSEFLANMSHEIRTPMNAIIGMTGLLLDTRMTAEQQDFAETIRKSADALLDIINDILDFSKIEAGKLVIEQIDFDLHETVEGTVELLAESAQSKELELASWVHGGVPAGLRGDPGRLRQVLTNLLGNAIKFTERGEVVIDVTQESENEKEVVLRFAVRDTGIGIPSEAQSRIFQAFAQADGSMTRRYGGTGLGLAICRQLVELMHGRIGFESQAGCGSVFWFTLPLEKQLQPRPALRELKSALEGVRVLIVDDNETNRQIVHHQILSWRMCNGSAAGGSEALAALKREAAMGQPYALAILDLQMPEMDGLTLARAIKADPAIAATKLVMLTSLGHLPQEREWKEAGIAAYLIKPVRQSRLFDCLTTVLSGSKPVPAPSPRPHPTPAAPLARTVSDPGRKAIRVLLAEDNAVNQKVALHQLHKLGYTADAVANGVEVLKALEAIPYAIVLMDCQMPEMDGYEATRQIRRRENSPALLNAPPHRYVVAMTANALSGDREECFAAGMDDYISKPVRLEELDGALQRGCDFLQSAGALAPATPAPALDPEALRSLRMLRQETGPDPLAEVSDLFLHDLPQRLGRLEEALGKSDAVALESAAHGLKGSASNLGAYPMAGLCDELAGLAREQSWSKAGAVLLKLSAELDRVRLALLAERNR